MLVTNLLHDYNVDEIFNLNSEIHDPLSQGTQALE